MLPNNAFLLLNRQILQTVATASYVQRNNHNNVVQDRKILL